MHADSEAEVGNAGQGEDAADGLEFGVSFGIGDMTLRSWSSIFRFYVDNDVIGVALTGISAGSASLGFGMQVNDDDTSYLG